MNHKRAVVIGAGISGLCASIYLRLSGYEVDLFELHGLPGGLCTSWTRRGYTFDGCIHWLLGSSERSGLHALWQEVVDMDAFDWVYQDEAFALDTRHATDPDGGKVFHLYADLDRLEAYLRWIAPEDEWFIRRFIRDIRRMEGFELPNLGLAPQLQTWRHKLPDLGLLRFMLVAWWWGRQSHVDLARKIKSPFLSEALELLFGGMKLPMVAALWLVSLYNQEIAGYPVGGSLAFARKIEERLRSLEGRIHYHSRVERILVEDGRAVGIRLADGTEHHADWVISAADGHWTLYEALEGRFLHDEHRAVYEEGRLELFPSLLYVSLGIRRRFDDQPRILHIQLPEPLSFPGGERIECMGVQQYKHDPTLAPEGCTMVNCQIESRALDFWSGLREGDRAAYDEAKRSVADAVVAALDARFGDVAEHVEVVDVATPATWHRYTNNWQGSFEGWKPSPRLVDGKLPQEVPGLDRFFMTGQWVEAGGGLPTALTTARNAVQVLCHRDGVPFMGRSKQGHARQLEPLVEREALLRIQ